MRENMKQILLALFIVFATALMPFPSHAQTPQQILTQYIADLQKNPTDYALREKIIKHVQTMSPAPAIPEEAEKFEGAAEYAFKNAKSTKSEADFLDAAKEYEKALLIAPWVSAYYYNQGVSFEMAGKLKEAKQSFEFYLLAAPNAQDARDVRKRIGGLEYAAEKAEQESSIAAKKQNEYEEWLRKIDGRRYAFGRASGGDLMYTIDVRGRVLVTGWIGDPNYSGTRGYHETGRIEIKGRETTVPVTGGVAIQGVRIVEWKYIISGDGNQITALRRQSNGQLDNYIYLWQR